MEITAVMVSLLEQCMWSWRTAMMVPEEGFREIGYSAICFQSYSCRQLFLVIEAGSHSLMWKEKCGRNMETDVPASAKWKPPVHIQQRTCLLLDTDAARSCLYFRCLVFCRTHSPGDKGIRANVARTLPRSSMTFKAMLRSDSYFICHDWLII